MDRNQQYYNFVNRKPMQHKPFVITIVGPESSGKTTLARQLAEHFGCPWVPEYAREYLEGLGRSYSVEDLEVMAKGQLVSISTVLEEQKAESIGQRAEGISRLLSTKEGQKTKLHARSPIDDLYCQNTYVDILSWEICGDRAQVGSVQVANKFNFMTFHKESFGEVPRPLVIVDSGMLSLRMWAKIKYGVTISWVEDAMREDVTSLYLLTRPLDNWEADPLREAPTLLDRAWIYNQFLHELSIIQSTQSILK